MAKRTAITTSDYLINAPLPPATATYTVIPHGTVMNITKKILAEKGFNIDREFYKCNLNAQVAQGVYHLTHSIDPDMGLLFAWNNSYDKSLRFRCSIGAYTHVAFSSIIGDNMTSWGRKHTGTADSESTAMIETQLSSADDYFTKLISDKEIMKKTIISEQVRGELMGRLYFVNELLNAEQISIIKSEFNKPSFEYTSEKNSVWELYNAIIFSLQKAHPRNWMDQQRMIHWFLCTYLKISTQNVNSIQNEVTDKIPSTDLNQTSLLDLIEIEEQNLNIEADEDADMIKTEEIINNDELLEQTSHMLHGVDNDNIEVNLSVNPEIKQEKATESTEIEITSEDDNTWICLKCGDLKGINDQFNDGQLCNNCI